MCNRRMAREGKDSLVLKDKSQHFRKCVLLQQPTLIFLIVCGIPCLAHVTESWLAMS